MHFHKPDSMSGEPANTAKSYLRGHRQEEPDHIGAGYSRCSNKWHHLHRVAVLCLSCILLCSCSLGSGAKISGSRGSGGSAENAELLGRSLKEPASSMKQSVSAIASEISRKNSINIDSLAVGTEVNEADIAGRTDEFFKIYTISQGDAVYNRINGKSYRANPDIGLGGLRYIKVLYCGFDGKTRVGELIVNAEIAEDAKDVFKELYQQKYQIRSMRLVDDYWTSSGDGNDADIASCRADNTSGFNYRTISGRSQLSNHAKGRAIDINTFENPWCQKVNGVWKAVDNPAADKYAANRNLPHCITRSDTAYKIFTAHGFLWGGRWASNPDYQHFEKP